MPQPHETPAADPRLAAVATRTRHGVIVADRGGTIEAVNPAFCATTGHADCRGRDVLDVLAGPETEPHALEEIRRAIAAGEAIDIELYTHAADGTRRRSGLDVEPHEGGLTILVRDLTGDHERRRRREQEHTLLTSLLENIPYTVFWKDVNLQYLGCNTAFATLAEVGTPAGILGKCDLELPWPPHETEAFRRDDREIMASGEARIRYREPQRRPDGTTAIIETSKLPLRDAAGRVVGVMGMYTDVTEEHEMRLRLAAERRLLESVITTIPMMVWWKDRDGRFLGGNRALCETLGLGDTSELVGKTDEQIGLPAEAAEQFRAVDAEVMQTGRPKLDYEERLPAGSGEPLHLETSKLPLTDEAGRVVGVLGVSTDVTEKKQAEARRSQQQKLESIGQLAAGIAHEINTPAQYVGDNVRFVRDELGGLLSVIQAYADQLDDDRPLAWEQRRASLREKLATIDYAFLRDELPEALDQSLEGVGRISKIVNAMKEFSHPGSRTKQPADLNAAIESTATICMNRWKYAADLRFDLATDLPPVPCLLGEFNQVVLNLIVNAADAIAEQRGNHGKGSIVISTRHLDGHAVVEVVDDGPGMDERTLSRIFDPFFTTKGVGKGTGQGLSISRDVVVRLHGGTIDCRSTPGNGAAFTIRLPYAVDVALPLKEAA